MQQLYRIEQMADEQNLSFEERTRLREKLAEPILISLEKWMEATYLDIPAILTIHFGDIDHPLGCVSLNTMA